MKASDFLIFEDQTPFFIGFIIVRTGNDLSLNAAVTFCKSWSARVALYCFMKPIVIPHATKYC